MRLFKLLVGMWTAGILLILALFPEYATSERVMRASKAAIEQIVVINRAKKGDFQ